MASEETFSRKKTISLHEELVKVVQARQTNLAESVFAIALTLRAVGEAAYDKEDVSHEKVFEDYKKSPSWPASLILVADLPMELLDLFQKELRDPAGNEAEWKEFGERLNARRS